MTSFNEHKFIKKHFDQIGETVMFSQSNDRHRKGWKLSSNNASESLILLRNLYSNSKWKRILDKEISQKLKDLDQIDQILKNTTIASDGDMEASPDVC